MAYSVRGRFQNQERYSTRRENQLLELTKTKAMDVLEIEKQLQAALDAAADANKKSQVIGIIKDVLTTAIPTKIDDVIADTLYAGYTDNLRDQTLRAGSINMDKIKFLKKVAENADTQLEETQKKMLEGMKFEKQISSTVVPLAQDAFGSIMKGEAYQNFLKTYGEGGEFANASLLDRTKAQFNVFKSELKNYVLEPEDYKTQLANYLFQSTPEGKASNFLQTFFSPMSKQNTPGEN